MDIDEAVLVMRTFFNDYEDSRNCKGRLLDPGTYMKKDFPLLLLFSMLSGSCFSCGVAFFYRFVLDSAEALRLLRLLGPLRLAEALRL